MKAGGPAGSPATASKAVHAPYRRESGRTLIELELVQLGQLFNSFDPAPFREKDLDPQAEEWITSAAEEVPAAEPLGLVVWLKEPDPNSADVGAAMAHYFAYRGQAERRSLSRLLRSGRIALVTGFAFMALCYAVSAALQDWAAGTLAAWIGEGLVIFGWVALWRPAEIFLYEWWPLRQQARLYERLAATPVEVRLRETAGGSGA